ncbi:hypothetical protein FACS1894139_02490 [Planctomycetales bacterium]|nr:hypothetical protein FACS1894139_02490 [Planctomycetales bacterium]
MTGGKFLALFDGEKVRDGFHTLFFIFCLRQSNLFPKNNSLWVYACRGKDGHQKRAENYGGSRQSGRFLGMLTAEFDLDAAREVWQEEAEQVGEQRVRREMIFFGGGEPE